MRRPAAVALAALALACRDGASGSADAESPPRPVWVADTQIVRDTLGQELEIVIGRQAERAARVEPRRGARDPDEPGIVRSLEPGQAYELLRAGRPRWLVIDLRGPEAFGRRGHIPGAFLFEPAQLEPHIHDLPVRIDQTILLYDEDGRQAREAARLLASYGFPIVRWLEGGFAAWRAADLPIEEGR